MLSPRTVGLSLINNASSSTSGDVESNPDSNEPQPTNNAANQRLKVEDALSYLDLVKVQFNTRPEIYSDFLDIMKDFKSQTIDTPGVIRRVSRLFRGRPTLIVGFNTFLPPGFRVKIEGNRIMICKPNGEMQIIAEEVGDEQQESSTTTISPPAPPSSNGPTHPTSGARPTIEFTHAISYVNKIKARFHHKPEVYKQFLEILHSYQKEQRDLKLGTAGPKPTLTENEVFTSVSKLFEKEPDLLCEFGQFLPDACGWVPKLGGKSSCQDDHPHRPVVTVSPSPVGKPSSGHKRTQSLSSSGAGMEPTVKKTKPTVISYEVDMSEASKYGTMEELQFFDKVRKSLNDDEVYDNFLRCLVLYNQHLVSRTQLVELISPFLSRRAELLKWFEEFLGCSDRPVNPSDISVNKFSDREGISSDLALEIDYASCKQLGVSYRALPGSYRRPKCSGRTELCNQILNDIWVSFPSWFSEDTSFVSSKKSPYEEYIYRTEDERFELDIVIEVNKSALNSLEFVRRKMSRMTADEAGRFRLDDTLGSRSPVLMHRAVRRIYGDKSGDIITGLVKNPAVAVPLVIKRLRSKDEEWRNAQKAFNRIWREQNEKYHLKSLDHQGLTFKQNDLKQTRSKVIINQMETLFDERQARQQQGAADQSGPHLTIVYPSDRFVFYDVADLLIHHVKRQTSIQKDEKRRIKRMLRRILPLLFALEQQGMSDDEDDDGADGLGAASKQHEEELAATQKGSVFGFHLLFAPNPWLVFLRLHQLMSDRLVKLKNCARQLVEEDELHIQIKNARDRPTASESLDYLPKQLIRPAQFYSHLISQIKNLLDNQIENGSFEDNIRAMFTTSAYVAFTMDKLVGTMVRQLQLMVSDELNQQAYSLYEKHRDLGGAGGPVYSNSTRNRQELEDDYQSTAEMLMANQNCFKIYFLHEKMAITFELIETDVEEDENENKGWSAYVQAYLELNDADKEEMVLRKIDSKPLLLMRNVRSTQNALEKCSDERSVVVDESLQANFDFRFKMRFVFNTGDLLLRYGAPHVDSKKHSVSISSRKQRLDTLIDEKLNESTNNL